MAGAADRRVVVQTHSAETVAYVLRAYADMISRPGFDDVGPFRVDVWDGGGIIETLGPALLSSRPLSSVGGTR